MINKLLVVYMKSRYDIYRGYSMIHHSNVFENLPDKEHHLNIHRAHSKTLEKIINTLNETEIHYDLIYRADLTKGIHKLYDCVMTVGGDGTFLEAADYIKDDTPIIAVSSGVYYDEKKKIRRGSEGAYAAIDPFDFDEKFPLFLEGKLPITTFNRFFVEYNGKKLEHLVLNEVSIGPDNFHKSMEYVIRTKNFEETQTNSGLIIAHAGNPWPLQYPGGSVLNPEEKIFQAVTTANYNSRYTLDKHGQKTDGIIIKHPNWIEIESRDRTATIGLDGEHKKYDFGFGTKVKVYFSDKPLKVIGFDKERRDRYYNVKREPIIRKIE